MAGAHRDEPCVTEDDAWKIFYSLKRDRDRKQKAGYRMELLTHERYSREVYPLMRQRHCPHKQSGAA